MSHRPRSFYEAESLTTELYDARAAQTLTGSPVEGDVEMYLRLARQTGGPVLDLGCGTGRVTLELAAAGIEVVGVDLSEPMLARARERADALSDDARGRVSFLRADMTSFALGRRFGLVITPFRSFQFLLTSETQRSALEAMRDHLRPGGLIVLDLFDPRLDWCTPAAVASPRRIEAIHPGTGNPVVFEVTERAPDPFRQLITETWVTSELDADGIVLRTDTETLTMRWSLRSELRHLVELCGLSVVAEYGDFRGGPPAYAREQVWLLSLASDGDPA